jgi:hypothetical protein
MGVASGSVHVGFIKTLACFFAQNGPYRISIRGPATQNPEPLARQSPLIGSPKRLKTNRTRCPLSVTNGTRTVVNTAVHLLAVTHLFGTAASECGFNPNSSRRKRMYTRIQDRSVDEIAARASQYLEGESGLKNSARGSCARSRTPMRTH